jgi:hypothetical protein
MHFSKIKHIRNLIFLLFLSGTLFFSCKHEPGKVSLPQPPEPLQPCDSTKVYFVNDVMPYVNSTCAVPGCHDNKGPAAGIDLSNYEAIMSSKVKGKNIVKPGDPLNSKFCRVLYLLDLIPMPPPYNYGMPAKGRENLVKWVLDSARNSACEGTCDTVNFTFRRQIGPLINKYCTGCHFGSYNSGNVLLTNYVQIKAMADSNKLYQSVTATEGVRKMPTGVVTMQPCEIIQIRKWIEAGAPNN